MLTPSSSKSYLKPNLSGSVSATFEGSGRGTGVGVGCGVGELSGVLSITSLGAGLPSIFIGELGLLRLVTIRSLRPKPP